MKLSPFYGSLFLATSLSSLVDGGCMVEKQKNSYEKCNKLNKNKCAAETLCVLNTVTDKCAHVCDDKEKSDCKKPTLKGKKMCKFQK
mmetsp:Transcript_64350/g.71920  ORF Transcript_64350/g.71920 Transcript_64350/m.71920 type:complete len:87 (-) Transcript_64350:282-542(-)